MNMDVAYAYANIAYDIKKVWELHSKDEIIWTDFEVSYSF